MPPRRFSLSLPSHWMHYVSIVSLGIALLLGATRYFIVGTCGLSRGSVVESHV